MRSSSPVMVDAKAIKNKGFSLWHSWWLDLRIMLVAVIVINWTMVSGHVLSTLESDVRNILQFQLASFFPALWLYDVCYVTKKLGSLGTRLIINTTIIPTIHYLQPLLQQVWLHWYYTDMLGIPREPRWLIHIYTLFGIHVHFTWNNHNHFTASIDQESILCREPKSMEGRSDSLHTYKVPGPGQVHYPLWW